MQMMQMRQLMGVLTLVGDKCATGAAGWTCCLGHRAQPASVAAQRCRRGT